MHALHVAAGNLFGGVERSLVEIATGPRSWTHEFALSYDGRLREELAETGAPVHSLGEVRFSRPTLWRARRRLARLYAHSTYDAVVCHSPWAYALAAPASGGRRRILWAHNALDGSHWTERRTSRHRRISSSATASTPAAALAGWLGPLPRTVVYPPVACGANAPGIRHEARRSRRRCTTTVIVMASRFERPKGQLTLLEAAAELRGDWTAWIAGGVQRTSEEPLAQELLAFVRARGLERRVRFLGERRDVPAISAGRRRSLPAQPCAGVLRAHVRRGVACRPSGGDQRHRRRPRDRHGRSAACFFRRATSRRSEPRCRCSSTTPTGGRRLAQPGPRARHCCAIPRCKSSDWSEPWLLTPNGRLRD